MPAVHVRCGRRRGSSRRTVARPRKAGVRSPSQIVNPVRRPIPREIDLVSESNLVTPHGGALVDRLVPVAEAAAFAAHAATLAALPLDGREQADLELIATGAASPLTGFLGKADYDSVLESFRLADGTVWPLPFTLAVADGISVAVGHEHALVDANGRIWGTIAVTETFTRDPGAESRAVYGTDDPAHPGVAYLFA